MITDVKELLKAARRELKMRRHVYPRWIEQSRMSQQTADHEIACAEGWVDHFEQLEQKERLI